MAVLDMLPQPRRFQILELCDGVAQVAEAALGLVLRSWDSSSLDPNVVLAAASDLERRAGGGNR